jgi:hypothetical protein
MRRPSILMVGILAMLALAVTPAALGATPQSIYRDFAENYRLDHNYSRADLLRAQRDSSLQGYPRVGVQGAIARALAARPVNTSGALPFTGTDLALFAVGGVLLLVTGTGLSRLAKRRNS